MPIYTNSLTISYLGYAAVFACMGIGFYFIKRAYRKEQGPGYWSLTFLLNAVGFVFSSGIIDIKTWQYFLISEIFHFTAFVLLLCGVYRFALYRFRRWNIAYLLGIVSLWLAAIISFPEEPSVSVIFLRAIRASFFFSSAFVILFKMPRKEIAGRYLAGISLISWGVYSVLYGFIRIDALNDFIFGLLPGFQILAAFGLLAMLIDRIRQRVEESDHRVTQLEKLLPTCSYCRKIRGKDNRWHNIEAYIEKQTSVQFSHGICPECLEKVFPDYARKKKERPGLPFSAIEPHCPHENPRG